MAATDGDSEGRHAPARVPDASAPRVTAWKPPYSFRSGRRENLSDCVRLDLTARCQRQGDIALLFDLTFASETLNLDAVLFPLRKRSYSCEVVVNRGDLSLELAGLRSEPARRRFRVSLEVETKVKRKIAEETSRTQSSESGMEVGGSLSPTNVEVTTAMSANDAEAESSKRTESAEYTTHIVAIQEKGSVRSPKWSFAAEAIGRPLRGTVIGELAVLDPTHPHEEDVVIDARFCVGITGIEIRTIDSIDYLEAKKKTQRTIERGVRRCLAGKISEYVSRLIIRGTPS